MWKDVKKWWISFLQEKRIFILIFFSRFFLSVDIVDGCYVANARLVKCPSSNTIWVKLFGFVIHVQMWLLSVQISEKIQKYFWLFWWVSFSLDAVLCFCLVESSFSKVADQIFITKAKLATGAWFTRHENLADDATSIFLERKLFS